MAPSLIAQFVDAFIAGFFKTMKEKLIDGGLLVGALLYWFFSGKLSAHFWESVTPWVWVICIIIVWHTFEAARLLSRQIATGMRCETGASVILSQYGKPVELQKTEVPKYKARIIGVVTLITLICAICSYSVWRVAYRQDEQTTPRVTLTPTELYMDCHMIALPISIAAGATVHVKVLNKKQYGNTQWAMDDIRNDGITERPWPDAKLVKSVKFNPGVFGYKCDVTNHAQGNLIDIAIQLSTNFDNEKPPLVYTAIISPLDAGNVFSFYIINECPVDVSVIAPEAAKVQVFGEDKRRTVPLHWPHRNPIEQIMMLMPSKVRWTGNACE